MPSQPSRHPRRHAVLGLSLVAFVLIVGLSLAPASGQRVAPTGAAPQVTGYLRIVDGDTIDTPVDGRQTGIGIAGVSAPPLNTPCGQEAQAQLRRLVAGGVNLEDDPTARFDSRKRRLFRLTRKADGVSIGRELVRTGFATATQLSAERADLQSLEQQARAARQGCLWGGAGPAPSPSPSPPATAAPAPTRSGGAVAPAAVAGGFSDELVASGLLNATTFTTLPDGRILYVEKWGRVRVIKNGQILPDPFIDLRFEVNDYWDRGMLGIAADPQFDTNGYVYFIYVYENNTQDYTGPKTSRVTRVTAVGDTASPASEVVLLGRQTGTGCNQLPAGSDCIPAEWPGHTVGTIKFAADGTLFVSNGDATTWNTADPDGLRAQNLDSLAGKLLHVTTNGQGVPANPFWNGDAGANRSKVWAYGLRNPYRFNLRPSDGTPYVGDVGWARYEELDVAARGANLGWPCYEGTAVVDEYATTPVCQALAAKQPVAPTPPLVTWDHNGVSAAVTAGAFYTGSSYPAQYQGGYFFGDYGQGWIRYLLVDASHQLVAGPSDFETSAGTPVDIQMGPDGTLWFLSINLNSPTGSEIRRLRYAGGAPPPQSPFLSDRAWTSAVNGWGPVERDQSNGDLAGGDGRVISVRGTTYAKGLGMHANADVHYDLGGSCTRFVSDIGVDDEVNGLGSVIFRVYLDGATSPAYDSGLMTGASAAKQVSLDVTGRRDLRLVVSDANGDISSDHADWANARVYCSDFTDTTAPAVTATTPPAGATGVSAATNPSATFSEPVDPFTLTASTVSLLRQGATTPVPATISYDGILNTMTLTPSAPLTLGATYTVTITGGTGGAADLAGNRLAADKLWSFTLSGNDPPVASITQLTQNGTAVSATSLRYRVGDTIGFTGSATDPQDGTLSPSGFTWDVIVHHCPGGVCHTHLLTTMSRSATGSFVVPDHGDDSWLELVLTATDSGGLQGTTSATLQPQTVRLTLATLPSGRSLVYGDATVTAPIAITTIVGSQHTVSAPSPQGGATFVSWSDGGAQTHNITVGAADITLSASFSDATALPPNLSDWTWTSMTNGCGPVMKDHSTGNCATGGTLSLRGITYAKGLGAHAASDVRYAVAGRCSTFTSDIGVDDETGGLGSVVFQVWLDGVKAFDSGVVRGTSAVQHVSLSIAGKQELRLVVTDAGDGGDWDHADWANAQVGCAQPTPSPTPTPTSTSTPTLTPSPSPTATATSTPCPRRRSCTPTPTTAPKAVPTATSSATPTLTPCPRGGC